MIILIAAFIMFFFLVLGSIAFLGCVMVPPGRRYALSTALWFAVWGPCCVSFLILAVLGLVTGRFALRATHMRWEDVPGLVSTLGWGSIVVGGIVTCCVASIATWLHQALIHRFTFLLFRLYASVVVAGIGSVFGWLVVFLAMVHTWFPHPTWLAMPAVPVLLAAFGAIAYRHARALRGAAPTRLTWISREEFDGPS